MGRPIRLFWSAGCSQSESVGVVFCVFCVLRFWSSGRVVLRGVQVRLVKMEKVAK